VNIQLASNNVYDTPFKSQLELYREFKQQMIGSGSSMQFGTPISYDDWICGFNPYCFDLSRNTTVKSNMAVGLTLEADVKVNSTGADVATNYDLCVIVERLRTVKLKISAGGVTFIMKDGPEV
jgi:hypothetical protein